MREKYHTLHEFYLDLLQLENMKEKLPPKPWLRQGRKPVGEKKKQMKEYEAALERVRDIELEQQNLLNNMFEWICGRYSWSSEIELPRRQKAWRIAWKERKGKESRIFFQDGYLKLEYIIRLFVELLYLMKPDHNPMDRSAEYNLYGSLNWIKEDTKKLLK